MAKHGAADLAIVFGSPHGKPRGAGDYGSDDNEGGEAMDDSEMEPSNGMPPDVKAAYRDYEDSPSAESLWEFVQACMDSRKG